MAPQLFQLYLEIRDLSRLDISSTGTLFAPFLGGGPSGFVSLIKGLTGQSDP